MEHEFSQTMQCMADTVYYRRQQPPVVFEEAEALILERLLRRAANEICKVEDLRIQIEALKRKERE